MTLWFRCQGWAGGYKLRRRLLGLITVEEISLWLPGRGVRVTANSQACYGGVRLVSGESETLLTLRYQLDLQHERERGVM